MNSTESPEGCDDSVQEVRVDAGQVPEGAIVTSSSSLYLRFVMTLLKRLGLMQDKSLRVPLSVTLRVMASTQTMLVRSGRSSLMRIRYVSK